MAFTFLKLDGLSVCLTVPSKDHVDLFLKLQNEEETRQYFVRYLPIGREQEIEWVEKANTTPHDIVFTIATYPALEAVGSVGFHHIHWKDRRATIGMGILEAHCNHGKGTHAAMLMLAYGFNELGFNKVEWGAVAYNDRSIACAKKCGGVLAGQRRRHIWRHDAWHDEVIFEIHADAWRPLWRTFHTQAAKKSSA